MPDVMHRRTCYFSGRVQGVGFRYTVKNVALQYNVAGFVKNLPDGRVELVMEGPDPDMDRLVHDVSQRMDGYIKRVDSVEDPATGEFQQFNIKH
jgi:acylphosphatase